MNKFIAAGDYTAKHTHWGSRLVFLKGNKLLDATLGSTLDHISAGQAIYWPTDIDKTLDLIPRQCTMTQTVSEVSSDHSPVIMAVDNKPKYNFSQTGLTNKSTNWRIYRQEVENRVSLDIDEAVEHFKEIIL